MELCFLGIVYILFKCLVKSLNDLNSCSSVQLYFSCFKFTVISVIQTFGCFPHLPGLLFPTFPNITNLLIFSLLSLDFYSAEAFIDPKLWGPLMCGLYLLLWQHVSQRIIITWLLVRISLFPGYLLPCYHRNQLREQTQPL